MADKRVNVLVYSGNGSTVESVRHCLWSLRRLLGPNYAVIPITGESVLKEPWTASCALFVMPGGADVGYCRTLNGEGNRKISAYVNKGGAYLGLCAGGYYACKRCEFEAGKKGMEVCGDRELGFYPGICRGLAFPGFVYHSEAGARAAELSVNKEALSTVGGAVPETFRSYYNGGGVFVDAEKYKDQGVQVLASYTERLHVNSGEGTAAVVYRKVGEGSVVLTGPHPEFAAVNLTKGADNPAYPRIVEALAADDKQRSDFMKACLAKLGLKPSQDDQGVPSLSRLHLSAMEASDISEIVSSWTEVVEEVDGEHVIKGENDTFRLEKQSGPWKSDSSSTLSLQKIADALPAVVKDALPTALTGSTSNTAEKEGTKQDTGIVDYDKVIKNLLIHDTSLPDTKQTPYFNHHAYFSNLAHYKSRHHHNTSESFGNTLLYGEVVTSTNTLLEKNPTLLAKLPIGTTATATTQVAGRGRGNNVWVSPPGSLMFSTILHHPISLSSTAPVVFIQYLCALAIVSGIQSYDRNYTKLPIKLKWPNDIYALDPSKGPHANPSDPASYAKIGGILINSSYSGGDYTLICGIGINVTNTAPTTSLNALCHAANLAPIQLEKLLASILVNFESLYLRFCHGGFSPLLDQYYGNWLHSGQIVTLEQEGGVRARITGITGDWGLLVAEELGWEDRPTGRKWELQSDSNSFDFFKGLLKKKT
ncbi:biotin holocarboxylase synthetase [Aureobasidium subglaciale]|nr:biotin holocarboxylase synthetase [Aureobasidium subglaciale]